MAITLTGGNGLFDMLGKLFYAQKALDAYRSGSLVTEVQDAIAVMDGSTPSLELRQAWATLPAAVLQSQEALDSYVDELRSVAAATIVQLADQDDPLPERSLEKGLQELIEQMTGAATVDANEPTVSLSYSTSISGATDKGRAAASLLDGRGRVLEYAYDEIIDALVSSLGAGAETVFDVQGEAAADPLSHRWPDGSGASGSLTAFDAAGVNNLIPNGTFDAFTTPNLPDGFTATAGSAGTDFFSEASTVFVAGGKSLKINAAGVSIALLSTTGLQLDPHTVYALGFWHRRVGTVSGGTLDISLYDGSANISDEAGNANAVQVAFGSIGTSWALGTAFFRLPDPVPATVKLRIRTGAAFSGGGTVYLDHLTLAQVDPLYPGGPYLAVFSGATPFEDGDKISLDVGNDYRGEFQTAFQRNFDMVSLGLKLPSATSGETINDSLIA